MPELTAVQAILWAETLKNVNGLRWKQADHELGFVDVKHSGRIENKARVEILQ